MRRSRLKTFLLYFAPPFSGYTKFGIDPIILLGLIMGWTGLTQIGVLLFTFVVLFQLITLPVEFNASSRALRVLEEHRLLIGGELKGATKVLQAAALTYVASLSSSILQLLRLILLTKRNDRRR